MRILFFIFIFLFLISALAQDQFNSYRWNRDNHDSRSGKIDRTPWYEWWYYKIVLPETNEAFFFTHGVVNPWDEDYTLSGTRALVEVGDFQSKKIFKKEVPVSEFAASYGETLVEIGLFAQATDKKIRGSFDAISWDVDIKHEWTFNATGWATGRQLTNIEWYPAQASAKCSGQIKSEQKIYQFTDAPCYQDRNWGHSFPNWWSWIVSNNFENNPDTVLVIGGGRPKITGGYEPIEGVAIGLRHQGKVISFRPNDMDYVQVNIHFGKWEVTGTNSQYRIEVSAFAPKEKFMDLTFMSPDGKVFHDYEALTGDIRVKLYTRPLFWGARWELQEDLITHQGGIEFGSWKVQEIDKFFNSTYSF